MSVKHLFFLIACLITTPSAFAQNDHLKLWYKEPAIKWIDALPVGNGRLGAMVYGNPLSERIALNESTLWCGEYNKSQNKVAGKEALDEVYQLFYQNKPEEAQTVLEKKFLSEEGPFGTHLPLGDLIIKGSYPAGNIENYKRELDIANSLARVSFKINDTRYYREVFASNPDQLIVIRFTADMKHSINQVISSDILLKNSTSASDNQLIIKGNTLFDHHQGVGSVKYYAIVNVKNSGGTCEASGDSIKVTGADELLVTVAINTDYKSPYDPEKLCRQQIDRGNSLPFNKLYQNHLTDFRNLFGRVSFSLNTPENLSEIPTDKRIAALVNGGSDPQLYTIFFQYGRYLLISGSRENSPLPMNLQGIWNDNKACHMSWTCDFHLDINVQQNYWPAEVCNLPESALPLASFVESLVEPGRETAKTVFGCNGWLTNTMVNAWGYTTPNWGFWGYFPEASSWIGSHLWEHYLFTQDQNFLRKRAYPVLKANAEFFLDYLRINPKNGYLMGPSVSPENSYLFNGKVITAANGPTVQSVLTYMLFSSCIESAWILKSDSAFREKLIKARDQLPPLKIGSKGQVQEWFEDFEEASPNHRHTSHLIALYPGSLINAETPELEKAATTTISNRMSRSDFEDVEWVRGNMVNFFARLRKGDEALNHLNVLFKKHCSSTFLSYSAAGIAGAEEEIFIIDGTTAGTAGVAEMLIQSHNGEIRLLPALPQAWSPGGSFSGLRARGGYTVDCSWKEGKVTSFKIKSETPSKTKVRINNETRDVISEKQ